jgi:hypothetical protein
MTPEEITHLGKKKFPVHRWLQVTPAYSPVLVKKLTEQFNCANKDTILDPFFGSGTTLLEVKKLGFNGIGRDINPFFKWKLDVELDWNIDIGDIIDIFDGKIVEATEILASLENKSSLEIAESIDVNYPTMRNINRWWKDDILSHLLVLKKLFKEIDNEGKSRFLSYSLAAILLEVANITWGRLQIAFVDRSGEKIQIEEPLRKQLAMMVEDIKAMQKINNRGTVNYGLADSTKEKTFKDLEIDHVITSPPYPNRYSYVWNTRPYMQFFDLVQSPSENSELDLKAIGGTWGRATYDLQEKIVEPKEEIQSLLEKYDVELREKSNLMANYVIKYFNMLFEHLLAMNDCLNVGANLAYVIGNSAIKKVYIPADEILHDMFKIFGYEQLKILRVRTRNSRAGLYEAIVLASRAG